MGVQDEYHRDGSEKHRPLGCPTDQLKAKLKGCELFNADWNLQIDSMRPSSLAVRSALFLSLLNWLAPEHHPETSDQQHRRSGPMKPDFVQVTEDVDQK